MILLPTQPVYPFEKITKIVVSAMRQSPRKKEINVAASLFQKKRQDNRNGERCVPVTCPVPDPPVRSCIRFPDIQRRVHHLYDAGISLPFRSSVVFSKEGSEMFPSELVVFP